MCYLNISCKKIELRWSSVIMLTTIAYTDIASLKQVHFNRNYECRKCASC